MTSSTPFIKQEVGYSPTDVPKVTGLSAANIRSIQNNVASNIMYVYLAFLLYMVLQLARERESKSREGMKMMGLEDPTYYLGWFLLFLVIASYDAAVLTAILSTQFKNINPVLMFFFLVLYSFSIFGSAWIMVAVLPSTTGAVILAIVYHFLTFNVSQTF